MRADRLLSILFHLQVQGRVTTRSLAERLEVSPRTIQRDMEALSIAGVPVYAERGIGGGWALEESYRSNLTGLNTAEVRAIFLGQPARVLTDLGLDKAADAALIKLLAALPSVARRNAEYARQRIYIDPAGWQSHQERIDSLPALQEAIWQERKVELAYRRSDDSDVVRVVDPLGLVAKGNVWYLIAAVDGAARTYRVSRIKRATLLTEASNRPPDFDLAVYWAASVTEFRAGLPRYPARLRIRAEVLDWARMLWRYTQVEVVEAPDAAGWVTAHVQFQTADEAAAHVLSLGPDVQVVEPLALRQQVLVQAQQIVACYVEKAAD